MNTATSAPQKDQVEALLNQGMRDQWYVIAKSSDVQIGKPFATKVLGMKLVLWRDEAGKVHCVEDFCPHRGAPLSQGLVIGDRITCAYHGVQITGEGVVAKVPGLSGCKLEGAKKLSRYVVEEHRDGVFAYIHESEASTPVPLSRPWEMDGDDYAMFLTTAVWQTNYRYALDNIADPMHGPYLHGDTFTLSQGSRVDTVKLTALDGGFEIKRVEQQGENLDWAEVIVETGTPFARINIPLPPAGGPGGMMRVMAFVTPVDEKTTRIFFWRARKVQGAEREAWRFLYRTSFEPRHWHVLEQDRVMLEGMDDRSRERENLYQHDLGITRARQTMAKMARARLAAAGAQVEP
jgi:phenylpropionate dioxygenase-like ring-hydroxylating dioxygenase large terminal subunit